MRGGGAAPTPRRVCALQVAEWLARPFDDLFGSSGVPVKALGGSSGRGPRRQQKDLCSVPENSKARAPPRKRAKPSVGDLPCNTSRQSWSQAQDELPWVERYKPETQDIPNQFYRDPSSLHDILRRFVRTSRCPLIFIISDNFSGDNNQRLLFPTEILEELCISTISFKPVAPTNMMKVLNRISAAEAGMNREKNHALDRASLELLCRGCSGDIRSAINSLQFSSRKGEPVSEAEFPQLPAHLSEFRRDTLLIQPEDIVEKSHMSGAMFNLYLHQNYVDFFPDIDDVVRASEYLSAADVLCSNWSYQENCLAAKSLFSSFCLPPECLQTELLPYLAMLANPMRNQAQIAFIQDVGRLPLKRHFGRLKLEALSDKDPGTPELFRGEGDGADAEPGNSVTGERDPSDPEGLLLPSSQCSGSELPGSQPQPVAAQAIMEEEELTIEEFDSD
ncbi:RAD17 checkpoint clamp loader component [Pitangus sulphuratus]|nr:RAD17 checkpoint clamp loader component [Pitangus sulphuratus]